MMKHHQTIGIVLQYSITIFCTLFVAVVSVDHAHAQVINLSGATGLTGSGGQGEGGSQEAVPEFH